MISESTLYHLTFVCDAIPPAGLHCHVSEGFTVQIGPEMNEELARESAQKTAHQSGWVMDSSTPRKYPEGRHLCPTCARRWPKVKWAKR